MEKISQKYVPVLIIDELQVIGDVKINELLIYKLFNFFIRLTKETHLAHVFAVSSDSLFVEDVYSEAMLQGRCDYLMVDDFDYEGTQTFLEKYGFSKDAEEKVWEYCSGKPVYLDERLDEAKIFLVTRNVLFVDPTRRTIRPQSKQDLLAIREILKEAYSQGHK